jgi:hypothetical protein
MVMRLGHKVSDQYQDNRAGDKMAKDLMPLYAAVLEGRTIHKFEEYMSVSVNNSCKAYRSAQSVYCSEALSQEEWLTYVEDETI